MLIRDESVLDRYRGPGRCELCGRQTAEREPHHVHTKGAGQVDAPWNLIALDRWCHSIIGSRPIRREVLLAYVAHREGRTVASIEDEYYATLRMRA